MARVEAAKARGWVGRTGDPVLDWFAEADEKRLAKAVHPLPVPWPIHGNCRCGLAIVEAGGEQWEELLPRAGACPICQAIASARRAEIAVARAGEVDSGTTSDSRWQEAEEPFVTEVSAEEFQAALRRCPIPAMLAEYSNTELAQMRLFLVAGQDAGFAIKSDGDLVNVFNGGTVRGLGPKLVRAAINRGAAKLDHFDTAPLNRLYSEAGFGEVRRVEWNPTYAPEDWDYGKYGRPDIVYRELKPAALGSLEKADATDEPDLLAEAFADIDDLMAFATNACRPTANPSEN